MKTSFLGLFFSVLLLFLNTASSLGQKKITTVKKQVAPLVFTKNILSAGSNTNISTLGIEDGLSNNSVNAIFKDKFGYMWFGTDDGLNRYDGYKFKVFRSNRNDTSSITYNRIICLAGDEAGNIWVGTNNGLSIYHNFSSTFTTPRYFDATQRKYLKAAVEINSINKDKSGGIWIATNSKGLLYKAPGKPLIKIPLLFGNLIKTGNVISLAIDSSTVWFVLEGIGLCSYNILTGKSQLVSNLFPLANCLYFDKENRLWIGGDQGLYRYDIELKKVMWFKSLQSEKVIRVTDIKQNRNGEIWAATDGGGVTKLNADGNVIDRITSKPSQKNLSSNAVTSLWFDGEGRTWMGTLRGGVNIIDNRKNKFKTIAHNSNNSNSLINDFVLSFCEDSSGKVWIGTDGGGISVWNRKTNNFSHFVHDVKNPNSLSNNNVTSIVEDADHQVWIGTFGGSINKYVPSSKSFVSYKCEHLGLEDKNIWKLYCDAENNIWAGTTFGQNLTYKLNRKINKFEVIDKRFNHVTTIAEDKSGSLWFGSEFGELLKGKTSTTRNDSFDLKHPIRALYADAYNDFWVGVQYTGLIYLNGKTHKLSRFTETEGLCNNSVLNILPDGRGNLWISTFNGISRFNLKSKTFKNFYKADGLQSNQFSYNAALRLKDGTLLFGGIRGFNYFNPAEITNDKGFPNLLVTDLEILNQPLNHDGKITTDSSSLANIKNITLPFKKASIDINFAALEYSAPQKIRYAYYLEGWDKQWIYATSNRSAYYSRLTEGKYVFHLKSTNTDGDWNPKEKLIYITILPPWYRSLWAYFLYLLALIAALLLYNRYRVAKARLEQELAINKIKIENEAALNENKLSFFTNISHEFRTPLTLIINPARDLLQQGKNLDSESNIQTIYRNSRRLLRLVDQLLLFRKADSGIYQLQISKLNILQLCADTFACFVNEAKLHHLNYQLVGDIKSEIYLDKEKIEIVLFNLLGNAIKYTPNGGSIILRVTETEGHIAIAVEDSGPGINLEKIDKLFDKFYQANTEAGNNSGGFGIGLYLAKTFINQHSGSIWVTPNHPTGSIFNIELKKGDGHFDKEAIYLTHQPAKTLMDELKDDVSIPDQKTKATISTFRSDQFITSKKTILIVDDNDEMRNYLIEIFRENYIVLEAASGNNALTLLQKELPDLIISDVVMDGLDGIDLCTAVKTDLSKSHIPIILLTASASSEVKLRGIKGGADDYIGKPFDAELLMARVEMLLKNRADLQNYFFNEILQSNEHQQLSQEQRDLLSRCARIINTNLNNPNFSIEVLANEIGMSHSNIYKKIKASCGQSTNGFIRFIRLRKAAEILIYTDSLVNEAAMACGINDIKYFRKHFSNQFGMQPSAFIKKHRSTFKDKFKIV
ncbi:MAG: response regulator [Pedobacter sp.]|nr:response regulator [Pedobacter sp.]